MEPEKKSYTTLIVLIVIIIILIIGGIYFWQPKPEEIPSSQSENVVNTTDTEGLNTLEQELQNVDTNIDVNIDNLN